MVITFMVGIEEDAEIDPAGGAISPTLPLPLAQAFLGLSARWLHGTGAPGALRQRDAWLTIKLEHALVHLK